MTTSRAERWAELARVVADGVALSPGDTVSVFLTDHESYPVAHAFCVEAYARGAMPHIVLTDERLDRVALQHADPTALAVAPVIEAESMRRSDVHVSFRGMVPLDTSTDTEPDPARLSAQRVGKGIISGMRWDETRWAIVRVPTEAWARYLGVEADTLIDEFIDGCLLDWPNLRTEWAPLTHRLDATATVRVVSPDTDLRLRVAGRTAVLFAGEANWPDGEIATAPLDDGVDGHITFPEPFLFASTRFEGLRLEFERGRVVEVSADRGADVARALIDTDDGSHRVGELGIGLNPVMRTWTGDLFMDEKILGTIHIALGRAYPQCGGVNRSSLHWDLVKDLREPSLGGAGDLYFDDERMLRAGIPTW